MKITLSELRQLVKNVIRESLQMEETSSSPLEAAKIKLEDIGFRTIEKTSESFKLIKGNTNVILADRSKSISSGTPFTIQINNEKPVAFSTVDDKNFNFVFGRLDVDGNQ